LPSQGLLKCQISGLPTGQENQSGFSEITSQRQHADGCSFNKALAYLPGWKQTLHVLEQGSGSKSQEKLVLQSIQNFYTAAKGLARPVSGTGLALFFKSAIDLMVKMR
jgi:hypothetical protein